MQRKTGFELKSLDEKGEFVGRVARLNKIDADGDVTLPGAFGNSQVAPIHIGHRWDMLALGKVRLTEEGDEVIARGKINLAMSGGRQLYEAMKFDAAHPPQTTQFSYGFSLRDFEHGLFEGKGVRFLKAVKVHEVSVVVAGAGDTALVAVKQDQDLAARQMEAVRSFLALKAKWATLEARLAPETRYFFLPPDDHRQRLALEAARAAAKELGIGTPVIMWSSRTESLLGQARPEGRVDTIALREDLFGAALIETVAHECFHLARPGRSEAEAERYCKDFASRHAGTGRPPLTFEQVVALAQTKLMGLSAKRVSYAAMR